jgi:hypothetical protein
VQKRANQPNAAELKERGWTVFDSDANPESLLKIANSLGTPVPPKSGVSVFSWLTPTAHATQHKKTFSEIFGQGKFPLHTDTAHWHKPARYLILCDLGKSHDRPTTVVPCERIFAALPDSDTGHAVWKVSGPTGYFPCSLSFWDGEDKGFRYDPLCMKPMNQSAESVRNYLDKLQLGGHRVVCPACGAKSWVTGEPISRQDTRLEGSSVVERVSMLPTSFACVACGLKLAGHSELQAVGLGGQFTRSLYFDAVYYYGMEIAAEEEYNNE